jgi:hypothetical protein
VELTEVSLDKARREVAILDERGAWVDLQSKDVPPAIVCWVGDRLKTETVDFVRQELGMRSPSDIRWRKIMTALRTGSRVDAAAIFYKWMDRNERLGSKVTEIVEEIFQSGRPMSKLAMEALNTLANLQLTTVKIGKELGVFVDPSDRGGQQGGVTIVVTTNVPSPTKEAIVVHQEESRRKAQDLLEKHRPQG